MPSLREPRFQPGIEALEIRQVPALFVQLTGGVLTVVGTDAPDRIDIRADASRNLLFVRDGGHEVARFALSAVTSIDVDARGGNDIVRIGKEVAIPATLRGGAGNDKLYAGNAPTTLIGGPGKDLLVGGPKADTLLGGEGNDTLKGGPGGDLLNGGPGRNTIFDVQANDTVVPSPDNQVFFAKFQGDGSSLPNSFPDCPPGTGMQRLTPADVQQLLQRAAAATKSRDAIIAVVDRNGRILGVAIEDGVSPAITGNVNNLVFAVDGAVAKARTAAFFSNNQAPLTSRTIQFISQTTITEREVNSNPNIPDLNSTVRGPGFVAPVGTGGHFPPNIALTPQVDLFAIEHTNRDSIIHPGLDRIKGTADDILLPARFNINPAFIPPGKQLFPPESFGFTSGLLPAAQNRGIATLPGGIPLYKNGCLVGGIGVFFPGENGYATSENSSLSKTYDPSKPDRTLEAEIMALVAAGGTKDAPLGRLGGVDPVPGILIPFNSKARIDLVGVTLDIIGPGGTSGPLTLLNAVRPLLGGNANGLTFPDVVPGVAFRAGVPTSSGWLVLPHDGQNITAAEVEEIIFQAYQQALQTRAQIRLPLDSPTKMVFAVTDNTGEVLGLYRMEDATIFSEDVAVAKARNVAYYANPSKLQAIDKVDGIPAGVAFTNRTFRYLAQPRFPEGIDGRPPGPFSTLNDRGAFFFNGLQRGPRLPASAYQSVLGYDAFNPQTNFRDPTNIANQNGVVFFPGAMPLYKDVNGDGVAELVGGFGVSGDGVDEDDVVTFYGSSGFQPTNRNPRADQYGVGGTRLPFQKFNRNPEI